MLSWPHRFDGSPTASRKQSRKPRKPGQTPLSQTAPGSKQPQSLCSEIASWHGACLRPIYAMTMATTNATIRRPKPLGLSKYSDMNINNIHTYTYIYIYIHYPCVNMLPPKINRPGKGTLKRKQNHSPIRRPSLSPGYPEATVGRRPAATPAP